MLNFDRKNSSRGTQSIKKLREGDENGDSEERFFARCRRFAKKRIPRYAAVIRHVAEQCENGARCRILCGIVCLVTMTEDKK